MQKLMVAIFLYYFEEAFYLMNITTNFKIVKYIVRVAKGNSGGWIMRISKDGGELLTIRPRCPELCKRDNEGALMEPREGTVTTREIGMMHGLWLLQGTKTQCRTLMLCCRTLD